jgi:hypothetical protein
VIIPYCELREFAKQAEIDQPHLTGNYSNLAAMARRILSFNRPHGSITENPIVRYLELREAMIAVRDPKGVERDLKWRITWYEMLSQAIPEDEIELFCSLLFASSLLSVVRYWYSIDALENQLPPYWDQWTESIQGDPLFQGDYAKAQDCGVRFSGQLEGCIRPVWGILSSVRSVISPHSLPTWILDVHLAGEGHQPTYCFWSDKCSEIFQKGAEILMLESRNDLKHADTVTSSKASNLRSLFRLEASRRYGLNF